MAIEYINAVSEFRPYFCEEPVPPENTEALREVREKVSVPIATGERLVGRHQFRPIFEQRACHVIQPDLCHCGGLFEAKKIAAMAETYQMGVAPHNPLGPVANAVALQFALSTPNFLIQEDSGRCSMAVGSRQKFACNRGRLLAAKSRFIACIEVDEERAKDHPFQQEVMHSLSIRAPDNAILDW
jgi:galactonate dehydratase